MKLLTTLAISKVAFGQVPDGGWVTGPDNIDTSLQTCGFFDIGKIFQHQKVHFECRIFKMTG